MKETLQKFKKKIVAMLDEITEEISKERNFMKESLNDLGTGRPSATIPIRLSWKLLGEITEKKSCYF